MAVVVGGQSSSLSHTLTPSRDLSGREEVFTERQRWQPSLFSGLQMLDAMHWRGEEGGSRTHRVQAQPPAFCDEAIFQEGE